MCGNSESIRSLSEWLKSWHERGRQSSQNCKSGEKCAIEDSEDSYENDSDTGDREESAILKNVLLITGPVGVRIHLSKYIITIIFLCLLSHFLLFNA